jgi:hypothetical protein
MVLAFTSYITVIVTLRFLMPFLFGVTFSHSLYHSEVSMMMFPLMMMIGLLSLRVALDSFKKLILLSFFSSFVVSYVASFTF